MILAETRNTKEDALVAPASATRGPVFIGGLAHSGKTPLRLALGAHSNIAFSRRTYLWNRFYGRFGDLAAKGNLERCLAAMLSHAAIRELCDDASKIQMLFEQGAPTYGRLFAIFHEEHAQRLGKSRWGDQLGFVERFADAIFEAYPTASMIHMIRDVRDSHEISMQQTKFRQGKVGRETAKWRYSASLAWRNQARYEERYRVVRFEALAAQPEKTLRALCDFLGEPYDAAMAAPLAARLKSKMPAGATGSRRTHDARRQLSRRQLAFTQTYAGKQLQALGYALRPARLSWADRLMYVMVDWPANRAAMLAWRVLGERSREARA